jgi:hypothetical protein
LRVIALLAVNLAAAHEGSDHADVRNVCRVDGRRVLVEDDEVCQLAGGDLSFFIFFMRRVCATDSISSNSFFRADLLN